MLVAPTVVSATSTCCVFSYLYFLALIAPTLAYVMQFSQRIFIAVRWLECPIVKVQNGHHEVIKFEFSKTAKKPTGKKKDRNIQSCDFFFSFFTPLPPLSPIQLTDNRQNNIIINA